MFKFLYFCGIVVFTCITSSIIASHYTELVTVVLMVKNEENSIVKTLQPYVDAGIHSFLIYDTGSTDNTVNIAHLYLHKHQHIRFKIIQESFKDFAYSRNKALRYAEKFFTHTSFLLMPDAEWYLHSASKLLEFCQNQMLSTKHTCYLIKISDGNMVFYVPRLFRAHRNIQFTGVVHELPDSAATSKVSSDIFFYFLPSNSGKEKTKLRWHKDKQKLIQAYKQDSTNPRVTFYLAQTYACLGIWSQAYFYYKKRTQLSGNYEENYMAFYKLAQATENLNAIYKKNYWPEALQYYLKAYSLHPARAEPLYAIARLYFAEFKQSKKLADLELAYLFAAEACSINYPKHDVIFIETYIYSQARYALYNNIQAVRQSILNHNNVIM